MIYKVILKAMYLGGWNNKLFGYQFQKDYIQKQDLSTLI